jgi:hypothetical protein
MHIVQHLPVVHVEYVSQRVAASVVDKYAESRAATGRSRKHTPFEEFVAPYEEWRRTRTVPEDWEADDTQAAVDLLGRLDRVNARVAYEAACKVAANFVEREWRVIDAVAGASWRSAT